MIVATCGQKGGSGKTTVSLSIADEWHVRGEEVLLIDADPQGTARTWRDIMEEKGEDGPVVTQADYNFHEQIPDIAENFDRIVIDCAPGDAEHDRAPEGVVPIQRSALAVADLALVPCGVGANDVWAISKTIELIQEAQEIRDGLMGRIVLTRVDTRTVISDKVKEALSDVDLPLLDTMIGARVAYQEMPLSGVGVTRYDSSSKAADEVRSLVDEIEDLEV